MQAIKCELCGSSDIMKQDGFFQCQNCGTKYSLEEARKLIGVVKIDKTDDVENLLTLARRYLNEYNYAEAEKYYELALRDAPNNWEASFFRPYCQSILFSNTNPEVSVNTMINGTRTSLDLIKQNLSMEEQPDALNTIVATNLMYIKQLTEFTRQGPTLVFNRALNDISRLLFALKDYFQTNFPEQKASLKIILQNLYNHIDYYGLYDRKERKATLAQLKSQMEL